MELKLQLESIPSMFDLSGNDIYHALERAFGTHRHVRIGTIGSVAAVRNGQVMRDEHYLKSLSTAHYALGLATALLGPWPIAWGVLRFTLLLAPARSAHWSSPSPGFYGWFAVILAELLIALALLFAGSLIRAGRSLKQRTDYGFCLLLARIELVLIPFGTALGLFALDVLRRPAVKALFPPEPCVRPEPQASRDAPATAPAGGAGSYMPAYEPDLNSPTFQGAPLLRSGIGLNPYAIGYIVITLYSFLSFGYLGVEDGSSGLSPVAWLLYGYFLPGAFLLKGQAMSNARIPLLVMFSWTIYMLLLSAVLLVRTRPRQWPSRPGA